MSIGLGAMRLSTEADRDDVRSGEVIDAAFARGVDLIDTADSYCRDEADAGHNERLIAAALTRLDEAARARIAIVTKGGLERPGGAWVPNGRARHLQAAAAASAERLRRPPDLYLLHAIDPGTHLATSVRALARIREAGHARAVGLSNVTPTQLAAALAITPIAAVEVELHPGKLDALRGGLVRMCEERGIRVLAHRPLGGPTGVARIGRDRTVAAIAARLGATACEVVLAWLRSLSAAIVTLPGATRVATCESIARAATLQLDDEARAALTERYLAVRRAASVVVPGAGDREVVMIAGMPASGKSTLAAAYVARGYARLNRDERGGSLLDLARALDGELAAGAERIVIDNTYGTRAQRAPVIEIARAHGAAIRCTWVATPIEQAQANAVQRILARRGRLLEEHEHAGEILPRVLHRFARDAEPPRADEGFDAIDEVIPARGATGSRRALIVELDGVLCRRRPLSAADVAIVPEAIDAIAAWADHTVVVTAWRPQWAAVQRLDERTATRIIVDPPVGPGERTATRTVDPPIGPDERNGDPPVGPGERTGDPPVGPGERTATRTVDPPIGPDERTGDPPIGPDERTGDPPVGPDERTATRTGAPPAGPDERTATHVGVDPVAGHRAEPEAPSSDRRRAERRTPDAARSSGGAPAVEQPLAARAPVAAFRAAIEAQLGRSIVLLACAHPEGPPVCWCRKPLPGLALLGAYAFDIDLARSVHVGRGPADRGFAKRAGCAYVDIAAGWPLP